MHFSPHQCVWSDESKWLSGRRNEVGSFFIPLLLAEPLPLSHRCQGLQRGREHLAGCSPWWSAGFRGIFPGSPDEWSLIAVGEGFASAAQCTRLTPLGRPCEEGLKQCWLPVTQPQSQHKCTAADSLTAGECVYKGTVGVRSHSVSGGMWERLRHSIHFCVHTAAEWGAVIEW